MKKLTNERLLKLLIIVGFLLKLKNTNPFMFNLIYKQVTTPGPIYEKVKNLRLDDINVPELLKNPMSILNEKPKSIFEDLKIPGITKKKAQDLHKWASSYSDKTN
jgi:hypothetical protein